MQHPRGLRNPKRARTKYTVERGDQDPQLAERFSHELQSILKTMGEDAPSQDESVTLFTRGGKCYFIVNNTLLHWDSKTRTAWRIVEAHGGERFEGWRNGRKIGDVHPPREAHWN
jgi:hypothetical protein